jgi:hypothetical protein
MHISTSRWLVALPFCLAVGLSMAVKAQWTADAQLPFTVAAYYWPDYHPDPRMEAFLGQGWTEYQMIAASQPKYPGHYQPRVPFWGPENESDPKVMEKKIEAATSHGVNCWIVDWYWYENQPFLESMLDDGFIKAANRSKMKFALMWANHTFIDIFPAGRPGNRGTLFPGETNRASFDAAVDHILKQGYFAQPNYLRIDGKIYFSIYELSTLINGLGGLPQTRDALDSFREKVREAGLGEMDLNAVAWSLPELPAAVPGDRVRTSQDVLTALGFDSLTSYTWAHNVLPRGPYENWAASGERFWDDISGKFTQPYIPQVSIGWDNNARYLGPVRDHINDSTPAKFQAALEKGKAYVEAHPDLPRMLVINAWNEWPEGSYLEPDQKFGYGYLDAVKAVFPPAAPTSP